MIHLAIQETEMALVAEVIGSVSHSNPQSAFLSGVVICYPGNIYFKWKLLTSEWFVCWKSSRCITDSVPNPIYLYFYHTLLSKEYTPYKMFVRYWFYLFKIFFKVIILVYLVLNVSGELIHRIREKTDTYSMKWNLLTKSCWSE